LRILAQHSWPGNIRELRNAIERATILVGSEQEIKPEHILL
jgi:two-component system response regulator FlrC